MAAAPPRPMSTVSTQAAVKSNTTSSPASLARHLFLIIPVPLSGPYCYVLCHEFSRVSTPTFHGLLPVITIEQERARGALGFPGGADLAAVPDDLVGEFCPAFPGRQGHEVEFNLHRVLVLGEAETLGHPAHVGVHRDSGNAEGVTQDDVRGFAADARELHQFPPGGRHLPAQPLHQGPADALAGLG